MHRSTYHEWASACIETSGPGFNVYFDFLYEAVEYLVGFRFVYADTYVHVYSHFFVVMGLS